MAYTIEQIEDTYLSHFAYLIVSGDKAIAIDPPRDPKAIFALAQKHQAQIVGVIETHPHADFVSSHLEISQKTGATLYAHELQGATYTHQALKDGELLPLNDIQLRIVHTPGHSPDSICLVLEENQKPKAVFTGDTLFIGDCGRPDLRESVGNVQQKSEALAEQMYHSLREKLALLPDEVLVYPAHGAGSLCGKALKKAKVSTIGAEKKENWALQPMSQADFVQELTSDQPFAPQYFAFAVALNLKGAPNFAENIEKIPTLQNLSQLQKEILIIDTRPATLHKAQHLPGSINLMLGQKFETWLGTVVAPGEAFYLLSETVEINQTLLARIASIGYESQVLGVFTANLLTEIPKKEVKALDLTLFKAHLQDYTIVDVRNPKEIKTRKIFADSWALPLGELRKRLSEIPSDKPIVVHCAAGYRSAAAYSILKNHFGQAQKIYDLSEKISEF